MPNQPVLIPPESLPYKPQAGLAFVAGRLRPTVGR
jgi:hypothetical protein